MSVVRLITFTDRPSQTAEGVLEISRFSCMLFPQRARALTTTQDRTATRDNAAAVLPSSYSPGSRHPDLAVFRSSITLPTDASGLRFETHLAMRPARLEVRMESLSPFP
jgi:hypothetical protein